MRRGLNGDVGLDWRPVPQDPSKPTPPQRAGRGPGRRRRFALPPDHHEEVDSERTTERIEAFLEGPARRPRSRRRQGRPEGVLQPRPILPLDTRTDWERALRHEDLRFSRYARPASVVVVDVALDADGDLEAQVRRVGASIRAACRETDRVARVSPTRFHVLLPETDEREATALADRIAGACREVLSASGVSPAGQAAVVRSAAASPVRGGSLAEALRLARSRLDAN